MPLDVRYVPSVTSEGPGDAVYDMKHRLHDVCVRYKETGDAQALVRALREEKSSLTKLPVPLRSDAVYRLSILLKRVERTCDKHFCGLWNECASGCQYADAPEQWREDMKLWPVLTDPNTERPRESSANPRGSPLLDIFAGHHALPGTQPSSPTLDVLMTRMLAMESKINTLEACLASAVESASVERSKRLLLEEQVMALREQLDAVVHVSSPTHDVSVTRQPVVRAPITHDMATKQRMESGWLHAIVSPTVSSTTGVTHVTAKPYLKKGPSPTLAELEEMARKRALELRWAAYQPGVSLNDILTAMNDTITASMSPLDVSTYVPITAAVQTPVPTPITPITPPRVTPVPIVKRSYGIVAAPYVRRTEPTSEELAEMKRLQSLESCWQPSTSPPPTSLHPYRYELHDFA